MDFLSVVIGALIGAAGTVVAAIIVTKSARTKTAAPIVQLPHDVLRQAREMGGLKRQLLLALRKYDSGKRIEPGGDRNTQQLAVYRVLAAETLANMVDTDSGVTVVTLTNRGWKVATAIDALETETEA